MTPGISQKISEYGNAVADYWRFEGELEFQDRHISVKQMEKADNLKKTMEDAKLALMDEIVKEYM